MTIIDDALDASSVEYAGKLQLKRYGQFLLEHDKKLESFCGYSRLETGGDIKAKQLQSSTPVALQLEPVETASVLRLVRSDNEVLNKVLVVVTSLVTEVSTMEEEARTKYYPAFIMYGESDVSDDTQVQMARFLPVLQEVSCFVDRCSEIVRNMTFQLAALCASSSVASVGAEALRFDLIFESLGIILGVLLTLDEIIAKHSFLLDHWKSFVRTIKLVHHNPEKFDTSRSNLKPLETVLQKLDAQLMSGYILQNCAEQHFDSGDVVVVRNQRLSAEFTRAIRSLFGRIERLLGENGETTERSKLVSIAGLCVFYMFVFRSVDKRSYKQIIDTYKKVPVIHLVGDVFWSPSEFLMTKFPNMDSAADKKSMQSFSLARVNHLNSRTQSLPRDCQSLVLQVVDWLIRLETVPDWSESINKDLEARSQLLSQGVRIAYATNLLAKTIVGLYVTQKRPMTRPCVQLLLRLGQLTKVIENAFNRHWILVSQLSGHIMQNTQASTLKKLKACKDRLQADNRVLSERKLDTLSALVVAQNALSGPATKERLVILKLAIQVASQGKAFTAEEIAVVNTLITKLKNLVLLSRRISEACDCSFLYWQRSLLDVLFGRAMDHPHNGSEVQLTIQAMNDTFPLVSAVRHQGLAGEAFDWIANGFAESIKRGLLEPLSQAVETDLRLSIHTHLQLDGRSPFTGPLHYTSSLLKMGILRIGIRYVHVKCCLEKYLERTFYNLNTVALQDWRTYAKMRELAKNKYQLALAEAHLPSQQLEQGLDVLEIMRNIHVFVAKYMYNLNNQIFVEKASKNKHLNTINIKHVANSIRTHGTGIMNTTVNFTYQFLRKKFYIFSQFLYDEQIKSRLVKDIRYFKENKQQLQKMYPFEKAEKFNRGIRRLGLTGDGLSYLDQFRVLITQIGNAMGYVRMIRSGGLQCCAQAIQFIPDLEDILPFHQMVSDAGLGQGTKDTAARLDSVISNLTKNFAEGAEYFRLLVDVFAKEFRSVKNVHLKNLYIIIPPLTVNYVEYILGCKEKVAKKATAAAFTDDGFAMGIAYILQLLDQHREFDSIHWFDSVKAKFAKQRKEMSDQVKSAVASHDEKLQQTMLLSLKRLESYEREFDLVYFSLSSARIFFRMDDLKRGDAPDGNNNCTKTSDSQATSSTLPEVS